MPHMDKLLRRFSAEEARIKAMQRLYGVLVNRYRLTGQPSLAKKALQVYNIVGTELRNTLIVPPKSDMGSRPSSRGR